MKVTVSLRKANGKERWCVDRKPPGQPRCREFFETKGAAEACAEVLRMQVQQTGRAWGGLTKAERFELISVYWDIVKSGHSLQEVWESFKSNGPVADDGPSLQSVIDDLIVAKRNAGRSERYVDNLESILTQFANGRGMVSINHIDLAAIEVFLDSKRIESRSTLRARLSTLFKFAVRRGYRSDNPCARLEPVTVHRPPPAIFTLDQFSKCLQWLRRTRGGGFPWFVLSSCCGLRPEEAEKTRKADIHFREGWIKVEAQTSKVRQRRVVYPKPEAMRLLKSAVSRGRLPITTQARRRTIRGLRKHLGWLIWPKDITRHTAASYWLASSQSASAVAESLGTAETTLKKHYKALVTKADAAKFWKALTF